MEKLEEVRFKSTLETFAYTLLLTKAITEIYAWAWSGTAMIDAK